MVAWKVLSWPSGEFCPALGSVVCSSVLVLFESTEEAAIITRVVSDNICSVCAGVYRNAKCNKAKEVVDSSYEL